MLGQDRDARALLGIAMNGYHECMNVLLAPELERFVQSKIESGRFRSAVEVVEEALRLLDQHDKDRPQNDG